tara:strand:- start:550 stop:732 length:183 start_codon:yes stop_codon:yes gene_type:complete
MSVTNTLQGVVDQLSQAIDDAQKTDNGNKSAGTRVRKTAQQAVNELKTLRKQVLAARSDG